MLVSIFRGNYCPLLTVEGKLYTESFVTLNLKSLYSESRTR